MFLDFSAYKRNLNGFWYIENEEEVMSKHSLLTFSWL